MTEFYDKYLKYKTKYINLKDKLELEGSGDKHNNYCVFFYDSGNTDIGILNNMVEGSSIKKSDLPKKVINLYKYHFQDNRIHSIYRPETTPECAKETINKFNTNSSIKIEEKQKIINKCSCNLDRSDDKKKINALINSINLYNAIDIHIENKNKLLLELLSVFKKCNIINTNFNINNNKIISSSLENNEHITYEKNKVIIIKNEDNNIKTVNTGVLVKMELDKDKQVSYKFILKTSTLSETQNNTDNNIQP